MPAGFDQLSTVSGPVALESLTTDQLKELQRGLARLAFPVGKIDGETVLEYEKPQLDDRDPDGRRLIKDGDKMLHEGYIALQSESHPIEFRKVEILPLKE